MVPEQKADDTLCARIERIGRHVLQQTLQLLAHAEQHPACKARLGVERIEHHVAGHMQQDGITQSLSIDDVRPVKKDQAFTNFW